MTWLAAITKLAPYVAEIAVATIPHFTQRKVDPAAIEGKTPQQQIAELQAAATQNADYIRKLAADLQSAITALEDGGEAIEARFRRLERMIYATLVLSGLSLLAVLALWLLR